MALDLSAARRLGSASRRIKPKFVEVFGADLRSLAAFRIVLALLVLASLAVRSTSLVAFYSDRGTLPRSELLQNANFFSPYSFSLNLLNGTPEFQALIFGITALAAIFMLVGYRTRLSTFLVWLLLLSIQFRNPLTLNAGDHLLNLLLFWGILLPLGAMWSVDRVRSSARGNQISPGKQGDPPRLFMGFFSMATVGLFLQIAFVYWFTAILKTGEEWRNGTALYYTLSNDQLTTQFGSYLLNFPLLLTALTFGTIALEVLGPFLFFSPIFNSLFRMASILAFMGLHFGIWMTMEVGMFPFVSALGMVCLLPGSFWDKALPRLRSLLRDTLTRRLDRTRYGKRRGKRPLGYPRLAVTYVARKTRNYLMSLWNWIASPVGMKDSHVYSLAGQNGLVEDKRSGYDALDTQENGAASGVESAEEKNLESNGGQTKAPLRSSLGTNFLAAFFVLYVFLWNVGTVSSFSVPTPAYQIGPFLGLSQGWGMFAPSPPRDDGWWVIPGELENGRQTNLLSVVRGDYGIREVSYEKPQDIAASVENEPWHKYLEFLTVTEYENSWRNQNQQRQQRENFASYLCRSWNARHDGGDSLESLQLVYIKETTLPDGEPPVPERLVLDRHSCE